MLRSIAIKNEHGMAILCHEENQSVISAKKERGREGEFNCSAEESMETNSGAKDRQNNR